MVEGVKDKLMAIDALDGDNPQLLLIDNRIEIYNDLVHRLDQPLVSDSNCGGEGICDTCLIKF